MDDFEYSIQISELDWDSFFQACEECNLLPPGLAGPDDSGMSDMDDIANQRTRPATQTASYDPEIRTDGPPISEGSPVELYLSKYGLRSPDKVLSGSEDDFHLEAVNVFFESLKSVSVTEDHTNLGGKIAGHFEGIDVKENTKDIAVSVGKPQSCRNLMTQRNDCHTYIYTESKGDDLDRERRKLCPDTKLFTREEDLSLDVLKEGDKKETKIFEKSPCNIMVNGKELAGPKQVKEAHSQLVTCNNSDMLVVQGQASNVTPRRRRRKKKRISADLADMDPGNEAPLPSKVSDSDDDMYGRRGQMDRDTHIAGYSGTVSEAASAPHDFISHPKNIADNFSVISQLAPMNIKKSTLVSTNLQKELSKSAVTVAQSMREIDIISDINLTKKPGESEQLGMRAHLKSPEPGVFVTETLQNDDNLSAHTHRDKVGNHLQLNNHLPSEMLVSIATSDVSKNGRKPESTEKLPKLSGSEQKYNVKSQTHSLGLQVAPFIPSHNVVYSVSPQNQFEDRVTLSDFQFDGSRAVGRRKTSISCVTLPELTDKTFFSASYKNSEKKENLPSVIHDEVSHECKIDDLQVKSCLSEKGHFQSLMGECVNKAQISHQNGHTTQMIPDQMSKADEIEDASLVGPKAEIIHQNLSKMPDNSYTSLSSQSEEFSEENSQFLRLKNVPESISVNSVELLTHSIKEDRNEEQFLKGQTKEWQLLRHTTEADSQLSDDSKSEPTLSHILTSEEQKDQIREVDKPPSLSTEELSCPVRHDLSPTIAVHYPPFSPPPESTDGAKSLETIDPDSVSQPTPPIYAISSFWDEMEKLTINDILRLRLVGQAHHPSVLLQPEESSIAEGSNSADSGYFTHTDESKSDRFSENISFTSDFDGELSSDTAKLDEGAQESSNPTGIIWESDPNLSGTTIEMEDVIHLDTANTSPLFRNNSNHCFRKMCKNISVQNLQALEGQNLGKREMRNSSVHSIHSAYPTHSEVEDDYVDPFNQVETSSPVYLSDEEEELDSPGITFSEIFEYLFGTDESKQPASEAVPVTASNVNEAGTSVLEMYEHFFSEFEPESLFYPLAGNNSSTTDDLVPIFSSSRSATRNVEFPDAYDYFFPDSPVHSDEDEEPEHAVIRVVTRYDHMPSENHNSVAASDPYEHSFPEKGKGWNFLWTNPFSFRKGFKGFTGPPEGSSTQALTPVKHSSRTFRGGIQPINILAADGSPFPDPLIFSLENRIFRQLIDQQKICAEMQTAVADPRLDAPLMPIKQADMCLVCIAFASWVLKSVNPQGSDSWKAVLLANVSALSAIRYLRRFTRDEATKISPLRQIKPA
ncbi:PGC-1 and ERR-induced regulator in muscle protein 1 [Clarias magur]|uniref:PGC-1 and ERR-induced regulator in muscle protein 1 n=1 Tax=Clarias magur TaxID=1594786 RepID=A0A8J4X7L8_CLAMG|nr:PGC-1 and ERR-induced regulator in muscle protein 1 [Clarias magur]